jgi:excisionase family DNA binding protein
MKGCSGMPAVRTVAEMPFKDFPDLLTVPQMCKMLGGISVKLGYRLLQNKEIEHLKIGREYRIPKINVMRYLRLI